MSRLLFHSLLLLLFALQVTTYSQITISIDDMPDPGDTIRLSTSPLLTGIDYESTGEDYVWNFTDLPVMAQRVDTFYALQETPLAYIFFFLQADVAKEFLEFNLIPGVSIEDVYQYYNKSASDYRELGIGVRLNGIGIPVVYDESDVIYRFPMNYGDEDSSFSSFGFSLPGLGYVGRELSRKNFVDGYGTLITPYGTFETLRIKSEIFEKDSLYLDTAGTGFPVFREYTEYKWLAKGMGLPVLQVTEEGILVMASYIDSVRTSFTGLADPRVPDYDLIIYPNPCREYLSIYYELRASDDVEISMFTLYGNEITNINLLNQAPGIYNRVLNLEELNIPPGVYLLHFNTSSAGVVRRVVKR